MLWLLSFHMHPSTHKIKFCIWFSAKSALWLPKIRDCFRVALEVHSGRLELRVWAELFFLSLSALVHSKESSPPPPKKKNPCTSQSLPSSLLSLLLCNSLGFPVSMWLLSTTNDILINSDSNTCFGLLISYFLLTVSSALYSSSRAWPNQSSKPVFVGLSARIVYKFGSI